MPRAEQIEDASEQYIEIPTLPWLRDVLGHPGFLKGGIYLLSGAPGAGKSTLLLQIAGAAANHGTRILYIATEQSLAEVKRVLLRIYGDGNDKLPKGIRENLHLDRGPDDLSVLPKFLLRRVLTPGQDYSGIPFIIIDSLQARGLAPSSRKYGDISRFLERAKAEGIVVFLVAHVTKQLAIAGPKALEHGADVTMMLSQAFRFRPLTVLKNRFGRATGEATVFAMESDGTMKPTPWATSRTVRAFGYGGSGDTLCEAQACVRMCKYGRQPTVNAAFLPHKKVTQLISVISNLKGVLLADGCFRIECCLLQQSRYHAELDLPLALALLGSYLQLPIDANTLFVGELDLSGALRAPNDAYLTNLVELLLGAQYGNIHRVFIATEAAMRMARMAPQCTGGPGGTGSPRQQCVCRMGQR